jgi:hypothetical protein
MFISRRDLNDVFDRLRVVESDVRIQSERDTNILEKLDKNNKNFEDHDENEMIKYDEINKSLDNLKKDRYLVIGGFLLFEILSKYGLISF